MNPSSSTATVTVREVFRLWLPLAGSWMLMGAETPIFTAFVARMADPAVHLATWGSLVFPLSLVIEGPVIQLLAASTALAEDRGAYRRLLRYTTWMSGVLTALHIAIAFTPMFDWVAIQLMGVPDALLEPGRLGLQIMTPWTAAIAYRRLHQGILIRAGRSDVVAKGTFIRLLVLLSAFLVARAVDGVSGILAGASAVALAVSFECVYAWVVTTPIIRQSFPQQSTANPSLTPLGFTRFYIPLALTPLITLLIQPAGAAGMARMPHAMMSLAAWPAVHGVVFLFRSTGHAFNEVVVALAGRPGGQLALRKFAKRLALGTMSGLLLLGAPPFGALWFHWISGLNADLAELCIAATLLTVLMPGYQVYQSWFQGILVHARQTRGISEAVVLYAVLAITGLYLGTLYSQGAGILWAVVTFTVAGLCQTAWLALRARPYVD
ncbi:MAG: hypothetical protein MK213_05165 [Planctomycetes bacterium]|nr:hypothetical protein [Planctomycetota bacterium]